MTTTFINTATTTALSTDGDDAIYVTRFGSVYSGSDDAISVQGDFNSISIDGVVASDINPVQVDGNNNGVFVGLTGQLVALDNFFAPVALVNNNNTLVSYGSITGGGPVFIEGAGHSFSNHGIVAATVNEALDINGENHTFVNTGDITGGGEGITSSSTNLKITNSGTITGLNGTAITTTTGSQNVLIENSGVINGDVQMAGVDMVYRGRADGTVIGDVIGGDNVDTFTGASLEDSFFGEGGADDLRGRAGDDIVRGGADDDLVAGNQGDDRVDGNQGDDTLFGNRGDDIVRGGSGDDVISGGRGDDVLTGNSGRDVFVFSRRTDDDIITDFRNNFDQLDLTAYGLENVQALRDAGALVESGAGSIIDLTTIGGDGVIYVDDMSVSDWTGADFIL